VVEHFLSTCKALGLILSTSKKKIQKNPELSPTIIKVKYLLSGIKRNTYEGVMSVSEGTRQP
jgi:hypothetical protein